MVRGWYCGRRNRAKSLAPLLVALVANMSLGFFLLLVFLFGGPRLELHPPPREHKRSRCRGHPRLRALISCCRGHPRLRALISRSAAFAYNFVAFSAVIRALIHCLLTTLCAVGRVPRRRGGSA